jgi:phage-related protein
MVPTKPIEFLGSSRRALAGFPDEARRTAGFQLDRVQRGLEPCDWKPIPAIGPGAAELRVRDESGTFRVVYVARFPDVVYVLHAFQKKSRKTSRLDLTLARSRYTELVRSLG